MCVGGGYTARSLKPLCRGGVPPPLWKAGQNIIPALQQGKADELAFLKSMRVEATGQASPVFK